MKDASAWETPVGFTLREQAQFIINAERHDESAKTSPVGYYDREKAARGREAAMRLRRERR